MINLELGKVSCVDLRPMEKERYGLSPKVLALLNKARTQLCWLQDGKLLGSEKVEGEAKSRNVEIPLGLWVGLWKFFSGRFLRRKTSVGSISSAVVGICDLFESHNRIILSEVLHRLNEIMGAKCVACFVSV